MDRNTSVDHFMAVIAALFGFVLGSVGVPLSIVSFVSILGKVGGALAFAVMSVFSIALLTMYLSELAYRVLGHEGRFDGSTKFPYPLIPVALGVLSLGTSLFVMYRLVART